MTISKHKKSKQTKTASVSKVTPAQPKGFLARFFFEMADYTKAKFMQDLSAGVTVGIVALPLSLALAIATGVPPILGLYTAGIAGFIAAVLAGSPYSVSGPAAAIVPILVGIIATHGLQNLPYIGILAGFMLIAFGVLGVGRLITKIPEAIVLGFTAGVAIVIFFGQLNTFFGLKHIHNHTHFHEKVLETIEHLSTMHMPTVVIGVLTLLIITQLHKIQSLKKIPPTLPAVAIATLLVKYVGAFDKTATVGSAYGAVKQGFPGFDGAVLTSLSWINAGFAFAAFKIAALIAVESLLCAMVADKMTKTKHRPGRELIAQGVANIASPMFMGIPTTAVIARTGTLIKADAKTRVAVMIHSLIVILFFVALAPVASSIPLTALAAVLLVTAVKISEYKEIHHSLKSYGHAINSVLLTTLVLTVFTDLVIGVSVGLLVFVAHRLYDRYVAHKRSSDARLKETADYEADEILHDTIDVD